MSNKFDAIAKRQAGEVPGFIGANESFEDFEARTAAENAQATADVPLTADPSDPRTWAPHWPSV